MNATISPDAQSRFNTLLKLAKMQRELEQTKTLLRHEHDRADELQDRWDTVRRLVGAKSDDTIAEVFQKLNHQAE